MEKREYALNVCVSIKKRMCVSVKSLCLAKPKNSAKKHKYEIYFFKKMFVTKYDTISKKCPGKNTKSTPFRKNVIVFNFFCDF